MKLKVFFAVLAQLCLSACVTMGSGSQNAETHRSRAQNIQSDGWNLMQSTNGGFSARIPGHLTFADFTYRGEQSTSYTLMSQSDSSGMYFEVTLTQGDASGPVQRFDEKYKNSDSSLKQFMGYPGIWDQRYGSGRLSESLWFKTSKGVFMLTAVVPTEKSSETDKFFASFSFNPNMLPEPNLVPAHVLAKLAVASISGWMGGDSKLQTMVFSGSINESRRPKAVNELTQMLTSLPKTSSQWGVLIEDQRVASEIFMEVLRGSNSEALKGLKLVFVGKEADRDAIIKIAKEKGVELSYVVRGYV